MSRTSISALAGLALTTLVALSGCGSSSNNSGPSTSSSGAAAAPATAGKGVVIGVKHAGNLGSVLYAGPNKLTVYAFAADHGSNSTCKGACAAAWPPVTTSGMPTALGGASTSALGTTERGGGVEQVTYEGHPLYYYTGDKTAASASGQAVNAFGAPWYVLAPSGSEITSSVTAEGQPQGTPTTEEKHSAAWG